jgi:uncharacterized protein (DUF362 family)
VIVSDWDEFEYQPPEAARGAETIIVKPNLGYPFDPPVTVSMPVLRKVLTALRRANGRARIVVIEGVCHPMSATRIMARLGLPDLLRDGYEFLDADKLECQMYGRFWAPKLLAEAQCRITVGAFKRTEIDGRLLISASIKNLYGLLPRAKYAARAPHSRGKLHIPDVHVKIAQVYEDIGKLFHGAVVDLGRKMVSPDWRPDRGKQTEIGKVVWGADPVAVDSLACAVAEEPEPDYLKILKGEPLAAKPAKPKPAKSGPAGAKRAFSAKRTFSAKPREDSRARPSRGWGDGPVVKKASRPPRGPARERKPDQG